MPTILNADASEPQRYARARPLRDAGLDLVEAATGQEALRLAAQRPGS